MATDTFTVVVPAGVVGYYYVNPNNGLWSDVAYASLPIPAGRVYTSGTVSGSCSPNDYSLDGSFGLGGLGSFVMVTGGTGASFTTNLDPFTLAAFNSFSSMGGGSGFWDTGFSGGPPIGYPPASYQGGSYQPITSLTFVLTYSGGGGGTGVVATDVPLMYAMSPLLNSIYLHVRFVNGYAPGVNLYSAAGQPTYFTFARVCPMGWANGAVIGGVLFLYDPATGLELASGNTAVTGAEIWLLEEGTM